MVKQKDPKLASSHGHTKITTTICRKTIDEKDQNLSSEKTLSIHTTTQVGWSRRLVQSIPQVCDPQTGGWLQRGVETPRCAPALGSCTRKTSPVYFQESQRAGGSRDFTREDAHTLGPRAEAVNCNRAWGRQTYLLLLQSSQRGRRHPGDRPWCIHFRELVLSWVCWWTPVWNSPTGPATCRHISDQTSNRAPTHLRQGAFRPPGLGPTHQHTGSRPARASERASSTGQEKTTALQSADQPLAIWYQLWDPWALEANLRTLLCPPAGWH